MKDIKNWIENEATDDELLQLVSDVHSYNGALEEYVFYDMESLNEFFHGVKPTEFLSSLTNDFNVNEDGYIETIYGLESCSELDAVRNIRNNAKEISEVVEEVKDEIELPESLAEEE